MSENIKVKLLVFLRYLGDSFFYPFLSLYLNTLLLGEAKIGFLISLVPLISIICNPIYSKITRNSKILKQLLVIIGIVEAIFIMLIGFSSNYYLVLVLIIMISISGCSHYGLMDSLMTIHAKNHNLSFSSFRIYGSLAYVFGTAISGILAKNLGYSFCFIISAILFILTSLIYLLLKPLYSNDGKQREEKRSFKEVFSNKGCIAFIIFYVLLYGIIRASTNFYSLLLDNRGIGSDIYGFVFSGVVIIEVITMIILNKLDKKLNYKIVFLLGIIAISATCLINGSNLSNTFLIAFWSLRGIAIAIAFHLNYKVLVKIIGIKNITIVSLLEELAINVLYIVTSFFGGRVIEFISYNAFYLGLAALGIIAIIYYVIFVMKYVQKNDNLDLVRSV